MTSISGSGSKKLITVSRGRRGQFAIQCLATSARLRLGRLYSAWKWTSAPRPPPAEGRTPLQVAAGCTTPESGRTRERHLDGDQRLEKVGATVREPQEEVPAPRDPYADDRTAPGLDHGAQVLDVLSRGRAESGAPSGRSRGSRR